MGFRIKVLILAAMLLLGAAGAAFASGELPVDLGSVAGLGGPDTSGSGDDSAVEGQYAGYENDEDEAVAGESATADGYGTDDDATEVDDENEVDDDDATEVEDNEAEIDDDDESNVTPTALPAPGNTAYSRVDDDDDDEADDSTSNGTAGSGSSGSGVSPTSAASGSDDQSHYRPEPRERD